MIRREIIVADRRTAYWEKGLSTDPTIVLLHGFRGNHKGLSDLAQEFVGFHLIVPDLPGYGESELLKEPHTLNAYAQWLDEFVGVLDLTTWYSWSHSYSGSIALIQAAKGIHKPTAIVSVSLAVLRPGFGRTVTTWYYRVGSRLPGPIGREWLLSRTVDRIAGELLFKTASRHRRDELFARSGRDFGMLHPQVITEQFMSSLKLKLERYAHHVTMPVLIIAGAKDQIAPLLGLQRLASSLPKGQLIIMEDQGHLAPIERPAHVATLTMNWLLTNVKRLS